MPNAFLSLNFQNLDLIKFARNFHAMFTSQPFLDFAQAMASRFNYEFETFSVGCAANRAQVLWNSEFILHF